MPSPGPGGSQSSLAGMVVSWLTSQFRTGPKQQPKKGAPIASYTMGTDPTALGGNARGDVTQFRDTFQPTTSMFQPNYPLVPTDRERVRAWAYPTSYNTNYTRGHPARPARAQPRDIGRRTRCPLVPRADRGGG